MIESACDQNIEQLFYQLNPETKKQARKLEKKT